jgi:hypothetical protein
MALSNKPHVGGIQVGQAKDAEIAKDDAWKDLCDKNGWTCQVCGDFPQRGNPAGYENGLCEHCRHPDD